MGIVGKYRYPVKGVDHVIGHLKRVIDRVPSRAERKKFAEALGMSLKSGNLFLLLSSMKMYGFIETGMGYIRITELGKSVCSRNSDVAHRSKVEAVRRIELFRDLYDHIGREANEDKIASFLTEKVKMGEEEAYKKAKSILRVYRNVLPYLEMAVNREDTIFETEIEEKRPGTIKITVNAEDFIFHKVLPFNKKGIESLQKLLNFLKSQAEELNEKKKDKSRRTSR